MTGYDPVPDAIAALQTKTLPQRFAIARLLQLDGPALEVLRWVIEQRDCDRATASMVFWRLLCLHPQKPVHSVRDRISVLALIRRRLKANEYAETGIAWDGLEAWERTPLIAGTALPDVDAGDAPPGLFGPFDGQTPEAATHVFFDSPYDVDDTFDSLWRHSPRLAAAADWLLGKPAGVWMAAVEEIYAGHPNDFFLWMVQQPECPAPVAGRIFWERDPLWYSKGMLVGSGGKPEGVYADVFGLLRPILERWRTTGFAPSDLDFSRFALSAKYRALLSEFPGKPDPLSIPAGLLHPVPGRLPATLRLCDDFDFWCIKQSFGNLVPRPKAAAKQAWQESRKQRPAGSEPSRGWRWRDLFR